tara:strand:- start:1056 stop:1415 length:360 start_codon:yes stop_codon:yes gene_type:complete
MANLITQVTLDRANRKKDKSVSLTFITQLEQSSEQFMEIDELLGDSGVIMFKSSGNLTTEEVKALDGVEIEVEGKTKSERLRNVLYVLNKQDNIGDFKEFYVTEMERIIEHYKGKLKKD